jgi:CubicO group peptidase (beta-lactamase class C family)
MDGLNGFVEEGWGPVADILRANLKEGRDLGAACAVYVDGRPKVNVWGGLADRTANRPWQEDTVVTVASTTKGAAAMCAHLLVQRGQLDMDAPVTRYWPEFGQAGKENVPVRYLLSHQVGLPYTDTQVSFEDMAAWHPAVRALEIQKPLWKPGTEHMYHAVTYGFLVGEIVRRVSGKTLGTFFQEVIARPLKLSAWIGLPEAIEPRVAPVEQEPYPENFMGEMVADFAKVMGWDLPIAIAVIKELYGPGTDFNKAGQFGGFTEENVKSRAYRAMEFPGGNMFTNAHSIARMYGATVAEVDGFRLLNADTVAKMTEVQTTNSRMHGASPELEPYARKMFNMSLGFHRPNSSTLPLLGPASFGHPGSGGSLGAGDPDSRVGFGYTPNLWAAKMIDMRAIELTNAVRKCLGTA